MMKIDVMQIKNFVIGGGSSTLLHYLSMAILISLDVPPLYATIAGAFLGAILNYLLQYHLTFKSNVSHFRAISSYLVSVSFGFFANIVLFVLFHEKAQINVIISQLSTTSIIMVINYILYKYIVFKPKESH